MYIIQIYYTYIVPTYTRNTHNNNNNNHIQPTTYTEKKFYFLCRNGFSSFSTFPCTVKVYQISTSSMDESKNEYMYQKYTKNITTSSQYNIMRRYVYCVHRLYIVYVFTTHINIFLSMTHKQKHARI